MEDSEAYTKQLPPSLPLSQGVSFSHRISLLEGDAIADTLLFTARSDQDSHHLFCEYEL